MIGNDIVDLAQAANESNWHRRGWLDKIFTPKEQVLITKAVDPDFMVWLFWSMKEAAYKAHQRNLQFAPRFNPKSFLCTFDNNPEEITSIDQVEIKGIVTIEKYKYDTESTATANFVHTIAAGKNMLSSIQSFVIRSSKTKDLFNKAIEFLPQNNLNTYQLQKNSVGIPQIFKSEKKTDYLISLSHHGRFGGCCIVL